MEKHLIKKGLVFAIILMFISVSFQHVYAFDINSFSDNIQNENDCGCGVVSNVQHIRFEKLLNRLELSKNKLLVLFKDNIGIIEEYEELSNRISTLAELNLELRSNSPIIICELLARILKVIDCRVLACCSLAIIFFEYYNFTLLSDFFLYRALYFATFAEFICKIMMKFDCISYKLF